MDLQSFIESIGYIGITAIVFAESGLLIGALLPGDSLLFTAGFLASQGIFDVHLLAVLTFIAAVVGDSVGYAFGHKMGPKIFKREDSLIFHRDHLQHAEQFYKKHGGKTVIIARFMPVVRTFAPILAGVGRMRYATFLFYNIIGALLWAVGLSYAGYLLGTRIPHVDRYLLPIVLVIILASVAPTFIKIIRDHSYRTSLVNAYKKWRNRSVSHSNAHHSTPKSYLLPQDYHNPSLDGFPHVTRSPGYSLNAGVSFRRRFADNPWYKEDVPLAQKTTFRLGGPADFFVSPRSLEETRAIIAACHELSLPLFILGGGSNVLFSDAGWRGVILQPSSTDITFAHMTTREPTHSVPRHEEDAAATARAFDARWEIIKNDRPIPPVKPSVPNNLATVEVTAGAGASLQQVILKTHQHTLVGLESFSGVPARVGGALRNNVHGGPDNFDRYVKEATLVHQTTGEVQTWTKAQFLFSYDHSILQQQREWIVWEVSLTLPQADRALWQQFDDYLKKWQAYKNATQTAAGTAGCIYKNLEQETARQHNLPASAGAIIDQYIGLGSQLRGAHVSTFHGNFLQNIASQNGTSEDMVSLINYIRERVQQHTGAVLEPEIEFVGF